MEVTMSLVYMLSWSVAMLFMVGIWRLRSWSQVLVMLASSWLVVAFVHTLGGQLAQSAGLDVTTFSPLLYPELYLGQGLIGWAVLLVFPCGWLAPALGLNLAQKMSDNNRVTA
jgi:hypothetical protein